MIKPSSILDIPRHALVIGNTNYEYNALKNPVNDATDVAYRLEKMDFKVDLVLDSNQVAMGKAIRAFTTCLSQEPGIGLFFFAGHGHQVDNDNYLLPIDNGKIVDKHDLQAHAINVNLQILARMEEAGNHLNFIILDACRTDPFRGERSHHQHGLAFIHPVMSSIIAFATAPGKTAADSGKEGGRNGLFTKHLLKGLEYAEKHNQRIDDMFMWVSNNVLEESGGKQIPWYAASLREPFYFRKVPPELKQGEKVSTDGVTFIVSESLKTNEKFSFEVVTVDAKGKIISHQTHTTIQIVEQINGIPLERVYVPSGEFMMGSPENEKYNNEKPQHKVMIKYPFYMGKYPITQTQWQAIMGNNPSYFKGDNKPVERVSWDDAVVFCKELSKITGNNYRLPSEAEWEYACRAGTTTPFHFGETITPDLANYDGNSIYGFGPNGVDRGETIEVRQFPPNAFGLFDMHGNVWEWCADGYQNSYNGAPTDGSEWKKTSKYRVLRGGSWYYCPYVTRAAYRDWNVPIVRVSHVGFRVVRSL